MAPDYVVLLHGIGRNAAFQDSLGGFLGAHGYRVINESYSTKRHSIREIAARYLADLLARRCSDGRVKIHFVTHSMGALVLRSFLQGHRPGNLGRVVMLAPPNQGSELADIFGRLGVWRWWMGPAGLELSTGPAGIHRELPSADFEAGVLIGDRSQSFIFNRFIPGPNDGRVSLARARLEGMADFRIVAETHDSITRSRPVFRSVLRFLETGAFGQ
jgi:triacylglycerol lipase